MSYELKISLKEMYLSELLDLHAYLGFFVRFWNERAHAKFCFIRVHSSNARSCLDFWCVDLWIGGRSVWVKDVTVVVKLQWIFRTQISITVSNVAPTKFMCSKCMSALFPCPPNDDLNLCAFLFPDKVSRICSNEQDDVYSASVYYISLSVYWFLFVSASWSIL